MDSHKVAEAIAEMDWIDDFAEPWQHAVGWAFDRMGKFGQKLEDFLHGKFLGHPLHAALVHIPVGAWFLAAILDLFGGSPAARSGADLAILVGIVFAIPSAITGSADYHVYGDASVRRIGGLHMLLNVMALVLYVGSYWLRGMDVRGGALVASYFGVALVGISGYLGGLLVYEKRIGTNHAPEPEDEAAPDEFVAVMPVEQLVLNRPTKATVGDTPVVLVRTETRVFALANACSHQGGPLSEGEFKDGCLVCPWHASKFRALDGALVDGPGVYNQPTFDVRVENGQVMVRAIRSDTAAGAEVQTPYGRASMR